MRAAPEGVAMLDLFFLDDEDWARVFADPTTDTPEMENLIRVCGELDLSPDETGDIQLLSFVLRDFELHGKSKLKTPVERRKGIEEVERLARALHGAMRELERPDLDAIGGSMPADNLRAMAHIEIKIEPSPAVFGRAVLGLDVNEDLIMAANPGLSAERISFSTVYPMELGRAGHIGREAERLAQAAGQFRGSIGDEGGKGGRRSTLRHYAWHVDKIAECVEKKQFRVGRGGDFERLCDAVWRAANVPSKAAGAIRECVRLRELHQDNPDDLPL